MLALYKKKPLRILFKESKTLHQPLANIKFLPLLMDRKFKIRANLNELLK